MSADPRCDPVQLEISAMADGSDRLSTPAQLHLRDCAACQVFSEDLPELDRMLARGRFDRAPNLAPTIMAGVSSRQHPGGWRTALTVAAVGLLVGGIVGVLSTRFDQVVAQDLSERFHASSSSVENLTADLVVVERGWHPDVSERVYSGSLSYSSPESLQIELFDATSYPDSRWLANDLSVTIAGGDMVVNAILRCPVPAMPECLRPSSEVALIDQRPFDYQALAPLEVLGSGSALASWSGFDVTGTPVLAGRPAIQIETTVAAVDLIGALTARGAWREFHPTDHVVLWLDRQTLVPLRVEVFATQSSERDLWQLRRGYRDDATDPILIVQLDVEHFDPVDITADPPADARSGGFVDRPAETPRPRLEPGFAPHRSGAWILPDGGQVEVESWSDGRSWIMVESTKDWVEPHLFGMTPPFLRQVDLGDGSVGYLDPRDGSVAIHGDGIDVLVSGSMTEEALLDAAASLGVPGLPVPSDWAESSIVEVDTLPSPTLTPNVEGWTLVGSVDGDQVSILMIGGGNRTILIEQAAGDRLELPKGPDFSAVQVRGRVGRINIGAATLEWVEAGHIIQMRSDTVSMAELIDLAETMSRR